MPTENIKLEKAVDNLIECRRKHIEAVIKAERERIIKWFDDICPHSGGIEEQPAHKSECPKCWKVLSVGEK